MPSDRDLPSSAPAPRFAFFRWVGVHRGPVSFALVAPLIAWLVLGGGAPADPLALRPTGRGALGGALVLAGAAVRLWAMGYRTKTGHFAEDGPYRWVRHPLYGGTLLLWLGFFVLAGDVLWGGLLFACIFAGVHAPQAVFEEEVVCGLFGEAYEAYRRRVPRWLPVRRPRAPAGRPWSLRRMRRNRALLTLLQAAGTLLGFKLLLFWRG